MNSTFTHLKILFTTFFFCFFIKVLFIDTDEHLPFITIFSFSLDTTQRPLPFVSFFDFYYTSGCNTYAPNVTVHEKSHRCEVACVSTS